MSRLVGIVENFSVPVGLIEETSERRYRFTYNSAALADSKTKAVSVTLPLGPAVYESDRLPGFFDGLIPEGWLLNITTRQWKIDRSDRMRLLLAVCSDCIGSVSVYEQPSAANTVPEQISLIEENTAKGALSTNQTEPWVSEKCLVCLARLNKGETLYHVACSRALFDAAEAPRLQADRDTIEILGREVVNKRLTLTGVQRKLSLSLQRDADDPNGRLTIVGLWGEYILKPPPPELPAMAANEHTIMTLAKAVGLPLPLFGLIPLRDKSLAYIVRRFDRQRIKNRGKAVLRKKSLEDFGQLFDRNQGVQKYGSSYNQVGRWLREHSSQPGLDLTRFFELTLFSFLVGNSDLHLKNISISTDPKVVLAPFYDLLSVAALEPGDDEELALPLGGKKNKLTYADWLEFGAYLGLPQKPIRRMLGRYAMLAQTAAPIIAASFLPDPDKAELAVLIKERTRRIAE